MVKSDSASTIKESSPFFTFIKKNKILIFISVLIGMLSLFAVSILLINHFKSVDNDDSSQGDEAESSSADDKDDKDDKDDRDTEESEIAQKINGIGNSCKVESISDNLFNDVMTVFNCYADQLGEVSDIEVGEGDDFSLWWITEDELSIINPNVSGIALYVGCEDGRLYEFNLLAEKLGSDIDDLIKQYGYDFNTRNSSDSVDDYQFYDYVQGYEKGDVKVVFTADPDCSGVGGPFYKTFSVSVANELEKNYAEQSPYLVDLELKDVVIAVDKVSGNFVRLNVWGRRSGHYLIAELVNGKWVKIVDFQGDVPCDTVNEYSIPEDLYFECY